jgi:hypothetical protein
MQPGRRWRTHRLVLLRLASALFAASGLALGGRRLALGRRGLLGGGGLAGAALGGGRLLLSGVVAVLVLGVVGVVFRLVAAVLLAAGGLAGLDAVELAGLFQDRVLRARVSAGRSRVARSRTPESCLISTAGFSSSPFLVICKGDRRDRPES